VYAAHPRGECSCFEEPFEGKSVIVIGNEANGVTDEMLSCCDKLLTIPMPGKAESLNASVAAALMIYEKRRKN
jgi:TrmH family RNA methyltransferase